jgi:hypothetical protein
MGFVDADTHIESRPRSPVLDSQRLRGDAGQVLRMGILPVPEAFIRAWRIERSHQPGSEPDVDELSGHEPTLVRWLR